MPTKSLKQSDIKGLAFIRNFVIYQGKTPTLRAIASYMGLKSPRSASLMIERLVEAKYIERTEMGNIRLLKEAGNISHGEQLIELPLVGSVPCGLPMLAEENVEAHIPVSQRIAKPGAQYFLLRAVGDSMNLKGINNGDLLVVRQQPVAENGDRVVALLGDSATVKEFQRRGDKIVLMSRSKRKSHQPIILDGDFMIQGVVIATLSNID